MEVAVRAEERKQQIPINIIDKPLRPVKTFVAVGIHLLADATIVRVVGVGGPLLEHVGRHLEVDLR